MDLKHSQMGAEIEVAVTNEKDSTEDETEVSKCQPFSRDHYPFLKSYLFQVYCFQWKTMAYEKSWKQLSEQNELCERSEICEIGKNWA